MVAGNCGLMWTRTRQQLAERPEIPHCDALPVSTTSTETATATTRCRALFAAALAPLAPQLSEPPVSAPTTSDGDTSESGAAGGEGEDDDGLSGGMVFLLVFTFVILPVAIVAAYCFKKRANPGGSQCTQTCFKRPNLRGPDRSRTTEFADFGSPSVSNSRLQTFASFSDGATQPAAGSWTNPQYVADRDRFGVTNPQYAAGVGGIVLNETSVGQG